MKICDAIDEPLLRNRLRGAMKCNMRGGLPVNRTESARRIAGNAATSSKTFETTVQTNRDTNLCF